MLAWTASRLRRSQLGVPRRGSRGYTASTARAEKELGRESAHQRLGDEVTAPAEDSAQESDNGLDEILKHVGIDAQCQPVDASQDDIDSGPSFLENFKVPEGQIRTHRIRKHGHPPLPLSPVIDPVFSAARNKWQAKKAMPPGPEERTPFQKKLYNNPYAHALATPVRESQLTNTHLPSHFLLPLSLHRSPEPPHKPVWTPSSLLLGKARGPQTYVDLSLSALKMLQRNSKRVKDVVGPAHQGQLTPSTKKEMRLRPEVDKFVLELLRKEVLRSLAWLVKHPNVGLVKRCDGGAYAAAQLPSQERKEVAAVLYLTPTSSQVLHELSTQVAREVLEAELLGRRAHNIQLQIHGPTSKHDSRTPNTTRMAPLQNPASVYPAARYPMVRLEQGGLVPVYGLNELLGAEKLDELITDTIFEHARCLVLLGEDARSLTVKLALMRLQQYLIQVDASDAVDKMAGK